LHCVIQQITKLIASKTLKTVSRQRRGSVRRIALSLLRSTFSKGRLKQQTSSCYSRSGER